MLYSVTVPDDCGSADAIRVPNFPQARLPHLFVQRCGPQPWNPIRRGTAVADVSRGLQTYADEPTSCCTRSNSSSQLHGFNAVRMTGVELLPLEKRCNRFERVRSTKLFGSGSCHDAHLEAQPDLLEREVQYDVEQPVRPSSVGPCAQ